MLVTVSWPSHGRFSARSVGISSAEGAISTSVRTWLLTTCSAADRWCDSQCSTHLTAWRSDPRAGSGYSVFAGREAARALAKMSLREEDCCADLADLTKREQDTLRDWEERLLDKYSVVGQARALPAPVRLSDFCYGCLAARATSAVVVALLSRAANKAWHARGVAGHTQVCVREEESLIITGRHETTDVPLGLAHAPCMVADADGARRHLRRWSRRGS